MSAETVSPEVASEVVAKAGGPSAVGRMFDISSQAAGQWKRIPAERVLKLEAVTGVSRYRQRPDIYGPEPKVSRKLDGAEPQEAVV